MKYSNKMERKLAGVCIECEGVPVESSSRCHACHEKYRVYNRLANRKTYQASARQLWSPKENRFVPIDEREAYEALRLDIAREAQAGAKGTDLCAKYKFTWTRLRKILIEYGVQAQKSGRPKVVDNGKVESGPKQEVANASEK